VNCRLLHCASTGRRARYRLGQAVDSPEYRVGRIINARSLQEVHSEATKGPTMRSPDGRLIRCPKCLFRPSEDFRWNCKCGHVLEHILDLGDMSGMPTPVGGHAMPELWRDL
jgi:hypothetical protein